MQALLARDPSALAYAIKCSCENKAEVVSLDEKETTLNLGHTFGHVSLQSTSNFIILSSVSKTIYLIIMLPYFLPFLLSRVQGCHFQGTV
ncbi:unnamed protein product [Musa acuminata subsp. malaccensis]|uniref:(wild Malaysian banana) hypothetical protein n=1 Tax=Musa acuminata subsp. malaccensis TaxID=214687 RepID=A0A804KU16_MUSAM|nr:unnamed protein product [Musa acuminata subsp. malaccensis]